MRTLITGKGSLMRQCQYVSLYSIQVVEVIDEDEDVKEVEEAGF